MKLPPHRYPGYYSLPMMLWEKFCSDKAAWAIGKVFTGDRKNAPINDKKPDSR